MDSDQIPQNTHERVAYKEEKKAIFLKAFSRLGTILHAAKEAGISREVIYDWRANDPGFLASFEKINSEVTQLLEETAFSRALERSDQLLMFLLKARKPAAYRDNFQDSIDQKEVERISIRFVQGLRMYVPNACPSCKCHLNFHDKVADFLSLMSKPTAIPTP